MDIVHCSCGDKIYGCEFVLHLKSIRHKKKTIYKESQKPINALFKKGGPQKEGVEGNVVPL